MPGYLIVFVLSLPLVRLLSHQNPTLLASIVLVAGPVTGVLFSSIHNAIYRWFIWKCKWMRKWFGIEHIDRLRDLRALSDYLRDYDVMACYDKVFFAEQNGDKPVVERILFLLSRAHFWGVLGTGVSISVAIWPLEWCLTHSTAQLSLCVVLIPVAFILLVLMFGTYSMRQASADENFFAAFHWATIICRTQQYSALQVNEDPTVFDSDKKQQEPTETWQGPH